jgi:NADPH-dependent curcumin reductase CurA
LELSVESIPTIGEGQLLVKNLYISIDPTHRIWMTDCKQYMPKVELGEVMRAGTIGIIEASNDPTFAVGSHVYGFGGCADYYVGTNGQNVLYPVGGGSLPLTADLSVTSLIVGLTAWYGIRKLLQPSAGDVVVVSGAAGAVGSIVGQLAKLSGAKVIGIAGGATKCAHLREALGFDLAVDYKSEDVEKAIEAFAREGVTHYFDNVGGKITDAVLNCMRINGKVAVCGAISEYDTNPVGITNYNMILHRRLSVTGFLCVDQAHLLGEAKAELVPLVEAGKLKYNEDVREGLEIYPSTVRLLTAGENTGKLILRV